jgi:hypothetical protein
MRERFAFSLLTAAAAFQACGGDDLVPPGPVAGGGSGGGGGAGGMTIEPPGPGPEFEPFCQGKAWDETLTPTTLGELHGEYLGALQSPQIQQGTMEGQKLIPAHPFRMDAIRVAFVGEPGPVRLRLMRTYGRSFPWPWPDTSDVSQDLMPPLELDVTDPGEDNWIELALDHPVFLLPTQHYMLVYEHLAAHPALAVEGVAEAERDPERDYSRAGIFFPNSKDGGGIGGTPGYPSVNYRMEARGQSFCAMAAADGWFSKATLPVGNDVAPYLAISDFDNDGHDDLVIFVSGGGPKAFLGDGKGGFSAPGFDPFAAAPAANMLVFGDIDNDGDQDAFASVNVAADADADGWDVIGEGDCNNKPRASQADPFVGEKVHPGAPEVPNNGKDDDCDGIADDGLDDSDADGDGYSILDGDCDDTEPASFPGNPEVLDMLDNDCNQEVDEVFVNQILINDGSGHFTPLPGSGVEVIDPSTSGAFSDADADGHLDLYWGNWLYVYPLDPSVPDRFFRGNGDGTFVDAQASAGLVLPKAYSAFGVLWNDYDNDADQDLLVTNYHLYPNQLWQNQGDGTFVDVGPSTHVAFDDIPGPSPLLVGGHTFGADAGDLDNDGDVDLYLANLSHPRFAPWSDPSQLLFNQGAPGFAFEDRLEALGMIYDEGDANVAFADYDNDGDLDVAIASLYESHFSRLYRNDGAAGFVDVTYQTRSAVRDAISVAWADVDEDGDLDLFVSDRGGVPYVHLFINEIGQDKAWVELDLVGTQSSRDAVGARVMLTSNGVTQMRDARLGGGHGNPQQSKWIHFGLGDASAVEKLQVRWLGGATETITGVGPRGRYRIVEGSGTAVKL